MSRGECEKKKMKVLIIVKIGSQYVADRLLFILYMLKLFLCEYSSRLFVVNF